MESLNFEITSNINSISSAVLDVMQYLDDSCMVIKERTIFEVRVILNELLINSIVHGNKRNPNKKIMIRVGISVDGLFFIFVEDEGAGYNFKEYINKNVSTHEISEMTENGRGIMIIENLCDKIKFNEKGNKVVVLKRI